MLGNSLILNSRYERSGRDDSMHNKTMKQSSDDLQTPPINSNNQDIYHHWQHLPYLPLWQQWYFPYIIAGGACLLLICLAIIIAVCCWRRQVKKQQSSDSPVQRVCVYSTAKPDIIQSKGLQPEIVHSASYVTKSGAVPILAQPVRVKTMGLLERRGSSQSLTIDLTPSREDRPMNTPPKESSVEEFLLSAGNRMSRKELRNVLQNVRALHEEFYEIPMNHPDKVQVAGSGTKNRYRTIIPNELTRVKLPEINDDLLSSYINANYIKGYADEPHAFIATQGPLAHTLIDFWLMVWHEKAPIIVMITKLVENDRVKCESYLPSKEGIYGPIHVTVENVIGQEHYAVRQLRLQYLHESRTIWHYWYHDWDDHKAPATAKQLLNLAKEVRQKKTEVEIQGPVLAHCSAGIGRTGCFTAVSIGMEQLEEEHNVDILGIVCSMRLDRGGMVQTGEQYEFIHRALCLYEKQLPASSPGIK